MNRRRERHRRAALASPVEVHPGERSSLSPRLPCPTGRRLACLISLRFVSPFNPMEKTARTREKGRGRRGVDGEAVESVRRLAVVQTVSPAVTAQPEIRLSSHVCARPIPSPPVPSGLRRSNRLNLNSRGSPNTGPAVTVEVKRPISGETEFLEGLISLRHGFFSSEIGPSPSFFSKPCTAASIQWGVRLHPWLLQSPEFFNVVPTVLDRVGVLYREQNLRL